MLSVLSNTGAITSGEDRGVKYQSFNSFKWHMKIKQLCEQAEKQTLRMTFYLWVSTKLINNTGLVPLSPSHTNTHIAQDLP